MALAVGGYICPGNDVPDGIGIYRALSAIGRPAMLQR